MCFYFCIYQVHSSQQYTYCSSLVLFTNILWLLKCKVKVLNHEGHFCGMSRQHLHVRNKYWVFVRQISVLLSTSGGTTWRVPSVCLLPLIVYFNWCPFLLKSQKLRPPSGDQLILISQNGNYPDALI